MPNESFRLPKSIKNQLDTVYFPQYGSPFNIEGIWSFTKK